MDILVVIDMQNDFIDGALGTSEAEAIVPNVVDRVKNFNGLVLATRDTHGGDYLQTQEGRMLPVEHCIRGTYGWEIREEIAELLESGPIDKPTFGSETLGKVLKEDSEVAPQAGNDIHLTIDRDLQIAVYKILEQSSISY